MRVYQLGEVLKPSIEIVAQPGRGAPKRVRMYDPEIVALVKADRETGHTWRMRGVTKGLSKTQEVQKHHPAIRALWSAHVNGAIKHDRLGDLTIDDFEQIGSLSCSYCGEPPSPKQVGTHIVYRNGLDRVDNSIPYSISNCVPCCWDCNRYKRSDEVGRFLHHVEKISTFQKQVKK